MTDQQEPGLRPPLPTRPEEIFAMANRCWENLDMRAAGVLANMATAAAMLEMATCGHGTRGYCQWCVAYARWDDD